jgi:17beta-estradiol 17-dehydrogenase / very-long-chain 3-oxoacyl-CoA reductase
VIGVVWTLKVVSSLLKFLFVTFLRPGKNIKKLGSWAVVTGATDGIGLALAKEIAKKGVNVVLVSRSADKLKAAEKEIKEKSPDVQTKTISFDFSKGTAADYAKLGAELKSLEIGLLYNNVGVSYDHAEYLQELTDEKIETIMEVNNTSLVKVTRLVLPGMLERKKGAIVNVGSLEGNIPAPFYTIYGASKAFVEWFSTSMNVELWGTGVTMHAHIPLYVVTKMAIPNEKRRKPSLFTPMPSNWARASLRAVGYEAVSIPYWAHAILGSCALAAPTSTVAKMRYNQSKLVRKIALKKKEAASKGQ